MDKDEILQIGDSGALGLGTLDPLSFGIILLIFAILTYCFLHLCWSPKLAACYSEEDAVVRQDTNKRSLDEKTD